MNAKTISGSRGFTLIELFIALTVLSIIVSVAVPSYRGAYERHQLSRNAIDLMGALNYSRSEAVRLGKSVVFCKSQNGKQCSMQSQWESGWLAFVDDNRNGKLDAKEKTLRTWPALEEGYTLRSTKNLASFLRYGPMGDLKNISDTETFITCHNNKLKGAKSISINRLRPRIGLDSNNDNIPEKIVGSKSVNISSCSKP